MGVKSDVKRWQIRAWIEDLLKIDDDDELKEDYLMDKKNHTKKEGTYTKQSKSYKYEYNVIPYQNHYIWGATAGMLINLYQLLK